MHLEVADKQVGTVGGDEDRRQKRG